MTHQELWQSALGEIEINISKANFITWFKQTTILDKKGGRVVVGVPNGFSKEWLQNKYHKLILKSLRNIFNDIKEIEFSIYSPSNNPANENNNTDSKTLNQKGLIIQDEQLGFKEFEVNKDTNLNPKYTFDTFIVGSFNELARAAAQGIVEKLGTLYNPLFIYGGVGLGKTHLLQSIGNAVSKKNKNTKIKYISTDKFTSELVEALYNGQIKDFKNKYQKIDLLIIDDIQFLTGKEKTQEEFFHIFNGLYQKNKQIILSSDRPPKAIATLEERLRSRFEGGMIADISYPDIETRTAILKIKAKEKNINLPDDIINYLATNISKNIRELEGALNRIIALVQLNSILPSASQIESIVTSIAAPPKKSISYKTILSLVAEFYDMKVDEMINKSRRRDIVFPRQVAMYLMRKELKTSYPFIGEKLGGRDHTTVMYACDKLTKELEKNNNLKQEIDSIKEKLYI